MQAVNSSEQDTRQRLIEAAGEEFADRGYRDATIRDICQRAGANVAAVNYHFGDKAGLYGAVMTRTFEHARGGAPRLDELDLSGLSPREWLVLIVKVMAGKIVSADRPAWHERLMAREMFEPTGVLEEQARNIIRPQWERLCEVIAQILPPGTQRRVIEDCGSSIVGQCVFYRHARPMLKHIRPGLSFDHADAQRLGEHIAAFSLGGLDALGAKLRDGQTTGGNA